MDMAYMTLIGGSGSGKSVSFCNMHDTLMDGVSFQKDGQKVHLCLVAQDAPEIQLLSTWYINMLKGKLPVNTAENKVFHFTLTRNNQPFCDVQMFDYRGSIRDDKDTPRKEREEFYAALAHSSILIYLIPGNILKDYQKMLRMEEQKEDRTVDYHLLKESVGTEVRHLRNINALVKGNDFTKGLREDRPPLLLYVTKSDLLPPGTDVMALLKSFIDRNELYFEGTKLLGCHSTLGPNVSIDESVTPHVIREGWEPEGFETPFLLSVAYSCSAAAKSWYVKEKARLESLRDKAKSDEKSAYEQKIPWLIGKKDALNKRQAIIDACEDEIKKLDTALSALQGQNKSRQYAEDIVAYIKAKGFPVLYLDEKKQSRDFQDLIL